jgi:hypothetical protein
MNRTPIILLAAIAAGLFSFDAAAQQTGAEAQKAAATEKWQSLTPEQKTAADQEARAKWDAATPEQKAAARAKAKARWESATPEQKAAAQKKFEQRHPDAAAKIAEKKAQEQATK